MAIQCHPGVPRSQLTANHFGIFGPTEYVRSGLGVFLRQARVPTSASPYFRLQYVFTLSLSYEGEAVDAVTLPGSPRSPLPLRRTSTSTLRQGQRLLGLAVDSAGSCGRLRSLRLLPRASRFRPRGPHEVLPLRYVDDFLIRGLPCGHMAAMKVSSCSPLRTSSSPLCLTEKCTTDMRRTRVRETGRRPNTSALHGTGTWKSPTLRCGQVFVRTAFAQNLHAVSSSNGCAGSPRTARERFAVRQILL